MNGTKMRKELAQALQDAKNVYMADKTDYAAGRYDGLKEALELLDRELDRGIER